MKITNKRNIPEAIYNAVLNDPYTRGDADISVTALLKPPRAVALERIHWDEMEEDASDRIWSLMGQAMHTVLERSNTVGISERRLSILVDGWKISGGMDHFHEGVLRDYKFVTAYKFKDVAIPEDWIHQLNIYSEMLRQNGEEVKSAEIIGILRDWSVMEAKREPKYPQAQIEVREIPLWSSEKVLAFVLERVKLHKASREILPDCTEAERWQRPTKWAVMKAKNKRAVKLHESEVLATIQSETDKDFWVQKRPGQSVKCANYCNVSEFCSQWLEEKKMSVNIGDENEI